MMLFLSYCYAALRHLHSFPTRRSSDLATLKPGAREKLAKISGILLAHTGLTLQIEGHTDSVGSDEFNQDRKSTRLNSSHPSISYAVFCLKKKNSTQHSPVTHGGTTQPH